MLKSVLEFRSAPLLRWQALVVLPVAGVVLGLIGPFGSYTGMDLVGRIGHFSLCTVLIGGVSLITSYAVARRFFLGFWPLWAALCVDLGVTVPAVAVVYFSLSLFGPSVLPYVRIGDLVWQNFLLALLFRAISLVMSWARIRDGGQVADAVAPEVGVDFGERLPRGLRREPVLAVSAEDHYLRVHTPKGEALIHMTLAEAVKMLPQGFQIHRSHWVSVQGVKAERGDRVELVTGLSLPVSRHRKKAFGEWLDQVT